MHSRESNDFGTALRHEIDVFSIPEFSTRPSRDKPASTGEATRRLLSHTLHILECLMENRVETEEGRTVFDTNRASSPTQKDERSVIFIDYERRNQKEKPESHTV